ncbi:hypothetical protein STIAU_3243 [Stigmatella aurantiaca DW4/3-1]|uniref:Uncharacterized protein n=1 Tax=Stigmatella aurantiaca (strain DW4/3-1) TaxID=378806 RepID=Q08XA2_STIAD|nr:hypothetical protein STIAU_3243 [Stigmatella aurantiaca DW4/3-1]
MQPRGTVQWRAHVIEPRGARSARGALDVEALVVADLRKPELSRLGRQRLWGLIRQPHDALVLLHGDALALGHDRFHVRGRHALRRLVAHHARVELGRAAAAVRQQAHALARQRGALGVQQPRQRQVQRGGVHVAHPRAQVQRAGHLGGVARVRLGLLLAGLGRGGRRIGRVLEVTQPQLRVRLARHLAEGHVVEDARQLLAGQGVAPAHHLVRQRPLAPVAVRPRERVRIALDGVVPVHHRLAAADGAPEVIHIHAARAVEPHVHRQQIRLLGDQERHRAAALRGLARRVQAVPGDVRAHHQRRAAPGGARGDPLHRRHQARGAAVAGVLGVIDAHVVGQLQQSLDVGGHRLGVIHPRLGAHHQHAQLGRVHRVGAQQPGGRRRRERHRVLAGIRDGHLLGAQARGVLGGIHPAGARQLFNVHVAPGNGDGQSFDSNLSLHGLVSSCQMRSSGGNLLWVHCGSGGISTRRPATSRFSRRKCARPASASGTASETKGRTVPEAVSFSASSSSERVVA